MLLPPLATSMRLFALAFVESWSRYVQLAIEHMETCMRVDIEHNGIGIRFVTVTRTKSWLLRL